MSALLVLVGGACGAVLRWWVGELVARRGRAYDIPWATVLVNTAGALALGVLAGAHTTGAVRVLLGTGVCGALTTFSAFAYDVVALRARLQARAAAGLVALHATVCLAAVWAGVAVGSLL